MQYLSKLADGLDTGERPNPGQIPDDLVPISILSKSPFLGEDGIT